MIWTQQGLDELENSKHSWTRGLYGFWVVAYQPNVLIGWVSGPEAKEMELHTNEEILESIMFIFEKFLGGKMEYEKPIRVMPSRWNSNPFTRGSYSSRSIETDERNGSAFDLSLPLNNSIGR